MAYALGMLTKRTYEDGCAAAHALNLVGERWALLVVRELLLGPKRFSDLRGGLPGISPNVLAQRLRDLEASGVVRREQLPPPAASWVYGLTPWGQELEPVLQNLGRWGARSPSRPAEAPISQATLISALKTMFSPGAAGDLRAQLALQSGREHFTVQIEAGRLSITRGRAPAPQASLQGDPAELGALILGRQPLAEAERGGLQANGDRVLLERFTGLFPMPAPVEPTGGETCSVPL